MAVSNPGELILVSWIKAVTSYSYSSPPMSPTTGDRYIVKPTGSGAWAFNSENVAQWNGSSWLFFPPEENQALLVTDVGYNYVYNGDTWERLTIDPLVHALDGGQTDVDITAVSNRDLLYYNSGSGTWVNKRTYLEEELSGTINGVNTTFTTANQFEVSTIRVYRNGLRQRIGASNDYTLIDSTSVVFTTAPKTGDILTVDYVAKF